MPTFHGIDLNLLVALEALLSAPSVTHAAARVGITQPAMSHALSRLRSLLGDPVLCRTPQGMVPTARAQAMLAPLRQILERVDQLVGHEPEFDPARASQEFCLSVDESGQAALVPEFLRQVASEAPNICLRVVHSEGASYEALARGEVDLMISASSERRPGFHHESVLSIPHVSIARERHPLLERNMTLKRFLRVQHIAVAQPWSLDHQIDQLLAQQGLTRRKTLMVPSLMPIPWLVARSDLVATVPAALLSLAPNLRIASYAPPLPLGSYSAQLVWHERTDLDLPQRWLRDLMRKIISEGAGPEVRRSA